MTSTYEGSGTRSLLLMPASLVSRDQGAVIDYLREENRVLRELLGTSRLPLADAQRRRLALRAKEVPPLQAARAGPAGDARHAAAVVQAACEREVD